MDVDKRENRMLEEMRSLYLKRNRTLTSLRAWAKSDPERADFIELIILGLE